MDKYITIPLSKTGKHAGKYEAIVSPEDADLLEMTWTASPCETNCYATHHYWNGERSASIRMHRVILERMIGRPLTKDEEVDHKDRNGLNNTRKNLRRATSFDNARNKDIRKNNTSGFVGITFDKGAKKKKWKAMLGFEGKKFYLGRFETKEEAYEAYCKKAKEIQGEFFAGL